MGLWCQHAVLTLSVFNFQLSGLSFSFFQFQFVLRWWRNAKKTLKFLFFDRNVRGIHSTIFISKEHVLRDEYSTVIRHSVHFLGEKKNDGVLDLGCNVSI